MRAAMSRSTARAVATTAAEPPMTRACSTAYLLLPLRAPPSRRCEWCTTVARVLPRRPVRGGGVGQVSWLSDRPTSRAFPIRIVPDQWPIAGFVPDYSDGVAADSHRLPWGPHPAGRPDTDDGATVTERRGKGKASPAPVPYQRERRSMCRRWRLVGRPVPGGRYAGGAARDSRGGGGGVRSSYRRAASLPLPRRSARTATRTMRRPRESVIWRRSPGRTGLEGLAASPLTSTSPPAHAGA